MQGNPHFEEENLEDDALESLRERRRRQNAAAQRAHRERETAAEAEQRRTRGAASDRARRSRMTPTAARRVTGQDGKDYSLFYGGVFSNFYSCEKLEIDGKNYSCTEQYFMYKKAVIFNDSASASAILEETSPAKIKALGRLVENFDVDVWSKESVPIMIEANVYKYLQNDNLRKELENTAGSTVVECSPTDRIWGIGRDIFDFHATDRKKWRGTNKLGRILEEIRECLLSKQWTNAEDVITVVKSKF